MTPREVIAATLEAVEAMIAEVVSILLPSIVLLIEILGRIEERRTIREYRTLGHETQLERLNQFINHSDVTCIDQLRVDRHSFGILCELLRTVGDIATNVLGICTPDMSFIFVMPGWEGSAADSRVLRDAINRMNGLKVPTDQQDIIYQNGGKVLELHQHLKSILTCVIHQLGM
ncbi:hypothetical protein Cni_G01960 [Canna indica]|uniref:Uncharacterized protein n=1 Tax=Canna indica TaxID=4628 RepID=A0AAQ3Q1N7_9LILI|nr:hypothetical protein Cni_G01960 [Canna indica]